MEISESEKEYIDQIIQEYEEGKKIKDIAKTRKTTESNIRMQLFELGGEKGKEILLQDLEMTSGIPIRDIILEYEKGKHIKQISDNRGITESKLGWTIKMYEHITGKKVVMRPVSELNKQDIVEQYRNGITAKEIADEIDRHPSAVYRIIFKYRLEHMDDSDDDIEEDHRKNWCIRRNKPYYKEEDSDIDRIIEKYRSGISAEQIAEEEKRMGNESSESRIQYIISKYKKDNDEDDLEKEHRKNYFARKKMLAKENPKKSENNSVKVASLNSVSIIIKKYGYTFEQLEKEAKKRGYRVTIEMYEKALELIGKTDVEEIKVEGEEVEW